MILQAFPRHLVPRSWIPDVESKKKNCGERPKAETTRLQRKQHDFLETTQKKIRDFFCKKFSVYHSEINHLNKLGETKIQCCLLTKLNTSRYFQNLNRRTQAYNAVCTPIRKNKSSAASWVNQEKFCKISMGAFNRNTTFRRHICSMLPLMTTLHLPVSSNNFCMPWRVQQGNL